MAVWGDHEHEGRAEGELVGTLPLIDNRPSKKCAKCGAPFDLTKYKGKLYCKNCLHKLLRWD